MYTVSEKWPPFIFFEYFCQKLTDSNDFGRYNHEKILHKQLIDLPALLECCSHCTLGNPKSCFYSTIFFTHNSDYLRYLRIKWTATVTCVQLNHNCLLTVIWTVLSRRACYWCQSCRHDTQHWERVCLYQENTPAHRARDTFELLRWETP